MANTQKYINHLLQSCGITPACSEEERAAADDIANIFRGHGFTPEIQEFTAPPSSKMAYAVLGILAFLGALFIGIGGALGVVGALLALAAAALFVLERRGSAPLSRFGGGGLSQNVIAYHKATGPLASPRNRPVVVVAHYDSPRADLLAQMPFAAYRSIMVRALPVAMFVPAAVFILRLLPFPDAAKLILWILAILASLVPLANAVAIIANRFVLPYTSGSVCNKSSVAAMLGVMDAVAPYQGSEEFPNDIPFDEYFGEQVRVAEAAARAAAAYEQEAAGGAVPEEAALPEGYFQDERDAASADVSETEDAAAEEPAGAWPEDIQGTSSMPALGDAAPDAGHPVDDLGATYSMPALHEGRIDTEFDAAEEPEAEPVQGETLDEDEPAPVEEGALDEPQAPADEVSEQTPSLLNALGNIRHGDEVIRALGMLPESCVLVYNDAPVAEIEPEVQAAVSEEPAGTSDEDGEGIEDGFDPFEPAEAADAFSDDPQQPYDDSEAYGYHGAPEEDPYDFPPPAPRNDTAATIASTLTAVGSGAANLFSRAVNRGKNMIENLEAARAAAEASKASADLVPEPEETDDTVLHTAAYDRAALDRAAEQAEAPADEVSVGAEEAVEDAAGRVEATLESETTPAVADAAVEEEIPAAENPSDRTMATQVYAVPEQQDDPGATVQTQPAPSPAPVETVDSLMAEISSHAAPRVQAAPPVVPQVRQALTSVPDPSLPSIQQGSPASRASLFDLPDPAGASADPFATQVSEALPAEPEPASSPSPFTVIDGTGAVSPYAAAPVDVRGAVPPQPASTRKRERGGLFGRRKKNEQSMSDWLGVEDDFDAKRSGRDIGSWDNFDGDDGWKGGATSNEDVTEEEMISAVASMGDDELLGHDIWFVATGASARDNAGMKAFLSAHRDKLRGVFFINLESVGAGEVTMLATEGEQRILKGDKRIMGLVNKVSSAFHSEYPAAEMPCITTDAHPAMEMSLRALTLAGLDGPRLARSYSEEDVPHRIDPSNIAMVTEVVTEVIRRS